jgi:hypothetical protein
MSYFPVSFALRRASIRALCQNGGQWITKKAELIRALPLIVHINPEKINGQYREAVMSKSTHFTQTTSRKETLNAYPI